MLKPVISAQRAADRTRGKRVTTARVCYNTQCRDQTGTGQSARATR